MTDKQACTVCGVDEHSVPECPTQPSAEAATEGHYPGCQAARRPVEPGELATKLERPEAVEFDWPEYHAQGMGCGLEDRGITDRYEAMQYGWDSALDRCAEVVPDEPLMTVAQHDRILRQATYLLLSAHIADMNAKATELELLRSALSHIIKTCNQSRTETRRLRWIAQRAQWALDGKKYDISAFDLPKSSATAKERLEREVKILREQVAQAGQVPEGWREVIAGIRRRLDDATPSDYDNAGYREYAGCVLDAVCDELEALAAAPAQGGE